MEHFFSFKCAMALIGIKLALLSKITTTTIIIKEIGQINRNLRFQWKWFVLLMTGTRLDQRCRWRFKWKELRHASMVLEQTSLGHELARFSKGASSEAVWLHTGCGTSQLWHLLLGPCYDQHDLEESVDHGASQSDSCSPRLLWTISASHLFVSIWTCSDLACSCDRQKIINVLGLFFSLLLSTLTILLKL